MAMQYPMYNNYTNGFQNGNYPNQYGITQQTQQILPTIPNQSQYQIQNGGFISVSSEEDARKYADNIIYYTHEGIKIEKL